jgi:hypothetical protein
MLVFGFIHFADVRFEPAPASESPPRVVTSKQANQPVLSEAPPPRIPSRWDGVMRNFANAGAWIGTVASIMLVCQLTLAVAVVASTAAPGVDHIVSAFHWGLFVAIVTLPMQVLIPAFPTIGVFVGYDTMAAASERAEGIGGGPTLILSLVAVPFISLFVLLLANTRLRQGIHAGVLVRSVNQFDQRIEEEIARVRAEGVGSNIGPRAVGVLGSPVGTGVVPSHLDVQSSASLKQEIDDLVRGARRPI